MDAPDYLKAIFLEVIPAIPVLVTVTGAIYTSPVIKLIIARNNDLWEVILFLPIVISIDGAGSAERTTRLTIKRTSRGFFTSDMTFDTYCGCLVQLRF
ncbi:hypothetical protein CY34DRAFT_809067 [Suillus luteus UH-Slu-Lm8-n1]|uniref:Uncharacterized protein n=1 Tax=Suillus luteus UH-Slu-Lm8-n1 TaxID=930992 RepID=A0A0D0B4C6_9AGAM|nr:hypothetical protein CY34DRAFT_809067 [Suillus luteus UH-Slu-Lm8-n1]